MKYKVGDLVIVRSDLEVGKKYGRMTFSNSWATYLGQVGRIAHHRLADDDYALSFAEGDWVGFWTDEMLLPAEENKLSALSPDAPVETNALGGKQSQTPYAFHMLPPRAVFAAAKTTGYGAKKYGETFDDRNYTKIPAVEHLNHAIQHIYAHLAGDTQDEHLAHAIVRLMFAYDVDERGMSA